MQEVEKCGHMILNANHVIDLTFNLKIKKSELEIKKRMWVGLRNG
jgi:hypothetical protein